MTSSTVNGLSVIERNGVVRVTCGCGGSAVIATAPGWLVLLATFLAGLMAGSVLMMLLVALT